MIAFAKFLLAGYFSSLVWHNEGVYVVVAVYAACAVAAVILARRGRSWLLPVIIAAITLFCFPFYCQALEKADFEQCYEEHNAAFAPPYDTRYALPAGRNRIYAYTIYGKRGQIKIGQTTQKTEARLAQQLRTANIRPYILWEIYAVAQNGREFTDRDLHRFLRHRHYRQIKRAGRRTEWFRISEENLHKELYRFYITY